MKTFDMDAFFDDLDESVAAEVAEARQAGRDEVIAAIDALTAEPNENFGGITEWKLLEELYGGDFVPRFRAVLDRFRSDGP